MASDDEELKQLEEELARLESMGGTKEYGAPEQEKKDNQFKFFREILNLPESWKVGNLKDDEIGKTMMLSIRANLDLGSYAEVEGLDIVQKYFNEQANIIAAPTMGRKGFMAQLFVTQIRKDSKIAATPTRTNSWFSRLTGGGNKNAESEQQ